MKPRNELATLFREYREAAEESREADARYEAMPEWTNERENAEFRREYLRECEARLLRAMRRAERGEKCDHPEVIAVCHGWMCKACRKVL